jgi:hypothetical protein
MKQRSISKGIIAGVGIAIVAAGMGFWQGYAAHEVCTGTGSYQYSYARVCGDDFLGRVGLFALASLVLLMGLAAVSARIGIKPLIRIGAIGVFVAYAVWVGLFSSSLWNTPYFMGYVYDPFRSPIIDFNCMECRVPTPAP